MTCCQRDAANREELALGVTAKAIFSVAKRLRRESGENTHYAGFDWAHDHHEVVIVNRKKAANSITSAP